MTRGLWSVLFVALMLIAGPLPGPGTLFAQKILRHLVVHEAPGSYLAWPSIARTGPRELLVFACRSEEHLGPDGAILSIRSTDNGTTWLPSGVVADTPIDDRECGVTPLGSGRLLLHVWSTFFTPAYYDALPPDSYGRDVLDRWKRFVTADRYRAASGEQGAWGRITTDGGRNWSPRIEATDAVHGGIRLSDSTLLCASYRTTRNGIGVFSSAAPSGPWVLLAGVASPRPDSLAFGEPHLLQLPGGRILMMIRATARPYNDLDPRCVLWESYSDDGGRTWATPFPTPLWGFPPHLLLLADGRVVCSYGYRRPPFGQRACISQDGITWKLSDEIILRDDAPNGDLGYPASIELESGRILTVYYQPNVPRGTVQQMHPPDPHRRKPAILGTVWEIR